MTDMPQLTVYACGRVCQVLLVLALVARRFRISVASIIFQPL